MNMNKINWHYTVWLPEIISDGVIQLCLPHASGPQTRAVWFSRNQQWEATVKKLQPLLGRHLTFIEMTQHHGFGRIGVTPQTTPHNWQEYQRLSKMPRSEARVLEKMAKVWGANPKEWFVSFEPVPRSTWMAVQVWNGRTWVDAPNELNHGDMQEGRTAA
jgi:hypothetical protein